MCDSNNLVLHKALATTLVPNSHTCLRQKFANLLILNYNVLIRGP